MKVPGGLAFSEFKRYEQAISISRNDKAVAVILGNPAMIDAYRTGFPGNGKPVPDGAKVAKIHWAPKASEFFPNATVPGIRLRQRVPHLQAGHHSQHSSATQRRQVRLRLPNDSKGQRLCFHRLWDRGEALLSEVSPGGHEVSPRPPLDTSKLTRRI